jgi:hypothetical protein
MKEYKVSKKCLVCGKRFVIMSPCQKCCSKECSQRNHKQYQDAYHQKGICKQYRKKYQQTESFKQSHKNYMKGYTHTDKYKTSLRLRKQTPKYKEQKRRYEHTDKYKQLKRNYNKTEKAQCSRRRYQKSNEGKRSQKKWNISIKGKTYRKQWFKTPTGKYRRFIDSLNRRAAENNCVNIWAKKQWGLKCEATKGICPCCYIIFGSGLSKLSLDHTPSLSSANKKFKLTGIKQVYTINEVAPLCLRCNATKGNKDISLEELRKIVMKK